MNVGRRKGDGSRWEKETKPEEARVAWPRAISQLLVSFLRLLVFPPRGKVSLFPRVVHNAPCLIDNTTLFTSISLTYISPHPGRNEILSFYWKFIKYFVHIFSGTYKRREKLQKMSDRILNYSTSNQRLIDHLFIKVKKVISSLSLLNELFRSRSNDG